ncbi:restriction endonuclease [Kribbella sp. NPDC049584]|uniref:restriction endonuclease n=1 Tax=Kribbella sp. NPDC049584 TaxID=3154833 RepID=UPI00343EC3BF
MAATYDPERERRRREREREREQRAAEAQRKKMEREAKQAYIQARKDEVAKLNSSLEGRVNELENFLTNGLARTQQPSLAKFRRTAAVPPLQLGDLTHPTPAPQWESFAPRTPGWWKRTFAQATITQELQAAQASYQESLTAHAAAEAARERAIAVKQREHEEAAKKIRADVDDHNRQLSDLAARAERREKTAVEDALLRIMHTAPIPKDFPTQVQIAYDPSAEHAILEWELPAPDCVPDVKTTKYVQVRDEIVPTPRPARERAEIYRRVVAQLCLLAVRMVLNADGRLSQVSFNGRVRHVNPATGHEERPHIISVIVERTQFDSLLLDRVQPQECLRHLNALVSQHPFELEPVEPLVEFDRSRLAFIEGLSMVSGLDARPDLMAMSPTEFEHLIRELFDADPSIDSVESLVTRQSDDGGVDGVIYIKQPFGRSMTVVQVKQYARSRALGPVHVRELIGSMHQVKAGNGLLVTTSDFTAQARTSARDFGRIELIDGNNLVHMIKELLKKDVLIGDRRR